MPTPEQQINVRVPGTMHKGLGDMAKKAGVPLSTYAGHLLAAAYSARAKPPSCDVDLDKSVGMVAILWAESRNTAQIAGALGLSEPTVARIVKAWREVSRDRVAAHA